MIRLQVGVRGLVQGVGFRPAVVRWARASGLVGGVRNVGDEVRIEVEGPEEGVRAFVAGLAAHAPALARLDAVGVREVAPRGGDGFVVEESEGGSGASLPPDLAPCDACLAELADPADRRFGYPFTSCTACGPRFTVATGLPWERARTTLAAFPLCDACRREYEDPADRRFHAEPLACPACGPRATLRVGDVDVVDPIEGAAALLREGRIVAVKGVGGWLLAVDARDEAAVARLRARKRRPHKPFAVMVRDLEEAERLAIVDDVAREALLSPVRSIVLVPARAGGLAPSVAPGLPELGLFLPPSPLQHLLAAAGPAAVVMTSGNRADEPVAIDDVDAHARLAHLADAWLGHDRPIAARADDSVVRVLGGRAVPLRRARGYAPAPIEVPDGPPVLAVGGAYKVTVCLAREGRAWLSPHLGDLGSPEGAAAFEEAVAALRDRLGDVVAVAHDLHPDYPTTRWAEDAGLPRVGVQHHHAHVAACLAEHGRAGPAIGVAFDGTGLGDDGGLWGGELLWADLRSSERLGHLRPLGLPGGEAAIREPWRVAVAALADAGLDSDVEGAEAVRALWARGIATPRSSGAGRWFDAVAAILGLCRVASYDGQAAIALEAASSAGPASPWDVPVVGEGPFELDLRGVIRGVVAERANVGVAAARFHASLGAAIASGCLRARELRGDAPVVLTGGCFQNRRLVDEATTRLRAVGFDVLTHARVPPNDGGLALGQAVVAANRLVGGARDAFAG